MIRLVAIVSAVFFTWIIVTMLVTFLDPMLAARGIEPFANRAFLDKEVVGVRMHLGEGIAFAVALLAGVFVAMKKRKRSRRK